MLTWSVPSRLFSPPYRFPGRRLFAFSLFGALAGLPGPSILEGGGSVANHSAWIFLSLMLTTVVLLSSVLNFTPLVLSLFHFWVRVCTAARLPCPLPVSFVAIHWCSRKLGQGGGYHDSWCLDVNGKKIYPISRSLAFVPW